MNKLLTLSLTLSLLCSSMTYHQKADAGFLSKAFKGTIILASAAIVSYALLKIFANTDDKPDDNPTVKEARKGTKKIVKEVDKKAETIFESIFNLWNKMLYKLGIKEKSKLGKFADKVKKDIKKESGIDIGQEIKQAKRNIKQNAGIDIDKAVKKTRQFGRKLVRKIDNLFDEI